MKSRFLLSKKSIRSAFVITVLLSLQFSCKKTDEIPVDDTGEKVTIQDSYNFSSTCSEMFLTARADAAGKPFLYIAAKDGGLKIYPANANAALVAAISVTAFSGLHVMNLSQSGNYLYLALGNHFGTAVQAPGMAIIDVSDPSHPVVKGFWQDNTKTGGCGIV